MSFRAVWKNWRFFITLVVPFLLLPVFFLDEDGSKRFKCAYVIIIMAIYWMTEVIPLAVTSFLPIVLFPLFGVQDTGKVAKNYMGETNLMFVGGLIIALSVEYCNLHKRIALRVMTVVGVSPYRLMLGIMLTTMFLSMRISNTATTAMMVPIVLAVLDELNGDSSGIDDSDDDSAMLKVRHGILFAIAYSSNIGGTGSILGSGPNLILKEKATFSNLTFATWMIYNVPPMLVNVFVAWLYLAVVFFGFTCSQKSKRSAGFLSKENQLNVKRLLSEKYQSLGRMTFHEGAVAVLFLFVVCLWLFREPRFMSGWSDIINKDPKFKIGDATPAMLVVVLLFIIPKRPFSMFENADMRPEPLLDWKFVQSQLPWGVVLLMGGGFALSDASNASGLSDWVGEQLIGLKDLPGPLMLFIVMIMTAFMTEVASNTACANVLIPILISLSRNLGLHPLYLTLPATVTCSYAFMLPVATPTNAIVYSAGNIKIMDMVRTGFILNVTCVTVLLLFNITYGSLIFDFENYKYPNSTHTL